MKGFFAQKNNSTVVSLLYFSDIQIECLDKQFSISIVENGSHIRLKCIFSDEVYKQIKKCLQQLSLIFIVC